MSDTIAKKEQFILEKAKRTLDVQSVGTELVRMVSESLVNKAPLTPESVVMLSEEEDSPLHDYFEWDDKIASQKYRVDQARNLVRQIKVVMPSPSANHQYPPRQVFVLVEEENEELIVPYAAALKDNQTRIKMISDKRKEQLAIDEDLRILETAENNLWGTKVVSGGNRKYNNNYSSTDPNKFYNDDYAIKKDLKQAIEKLIQAKKQIQPYMTVRPVADVLTEQIETLTKRLHEIEHREQDDSEFKRNERYKIDTEKSTHGNIKEAEAEEMVLDAIKAKNYVRSEIREWTGLDYSTINAAVERLEEKEILKRTWQGNFDKFTLKTDEKRGD